MHAKKAEKVLKNKVLNEKYFNKFQESQHFFCFFSPELITEKKNGGMEKLFVTHHLVKSPRSRSGGSVAFHGWAQRYLKLTNSNDLCGEASLEPSEPSSFMMGGFFLLTQK